MITPFGLGSQGKEDMRQIIRHTSRLSVKTCTGGFDRTAGRCVGRGYRTDVFDHATWPRDIEIHPVIRLRVTALKPQSRALVETHTCDWRHVPRRIDRFVL